MNLLAWSLPNGFNSTLQNKNRHGNLTFSSGVLPQVLQEGCGQASPPKLA